jgi:hypothetical protein
MPIVKITGQGLSAIALSVALLWTCLLTERRVFHKAAVKQSEILKEIEHLRRHVDRPRLPFQNRPPKPSFG